MFDAVPYVYGQRYVVRAESGESARILQPTFWLHGRLGPLGLETELDMPMLILW